MKKIKIPFTNKVIVDEDVWSEIERYKYIYNKYNSSMNRVLLAGHGSYMIDEHITYYAVCLQINGFTVPIKSFPFGDDKEYAKLCAEELLEMLKND